MKRGFFFRKLLVWILMLSCMFTYSLQPTAAASKAKLKSVSATLKTGSTCRKVENIYFIMKGKKIKISVKPVLTKKAKTKFSKSFTSSNKKVITVSKLGIINAKKEGTSFILVKGSVKGSKKVKKGTKKNKIKVIVLSVKNFKAKFDKKKPVPAPEPKPETPAIDKPTDSEQTPSVIDDKPTTDSTISDKPEEPGNSGNDSSEGSTSSTDTGSGSLEDPKPEDPVNPTPGTNEGDVITPSNPNEEDSTVEEGNTGNTDNTGNTEETTTENPNPTTPTIPENKMRYDYKVRFFNQPMSKVTVSLFIETENPDQRNFNLRFYNAQGKYINITSGLGTNKGFIDIEPLTNKGTITKVNGGYVATVTFRESGMIKVAAIEYLEGENGVKHTKQPEEKILGMITVKDGPEEEEQWINSIIEQSTNNEMTPKEKMQAVNDYLKSFAKYRKNYIDSNHEMQYLHFCVDEGLTAWERNEWDSYDSPGLLVAIGEKIGYPVRSMYYDYEYGTSEWNKYHWKVESIEDGTMYGFCPNSSTNRYSNIHSEADVPKINCLTYDKYYDLY